MADTDVAIDYGKGLTLESVWALFRETSAQMKETDRQMEKNNRHCNEELDKITRNLEKTDILLDKIAERQAKTDILLDKIAERQAETAERQAKIDAQQAKNDEQQAKTDAQMARTDAQMARTDAKIAEVNKQIEGVNKQIEGVNRALCNWSVEMISTELWAKFDKVGYKFTKGSRTVYRNKRREVIAEVDSFLENGDYAMPVEIKSQFRIEDVDEHIKRIEVIRKYMDERNDNRKLIGGIAGAVIPEGVRRYAQKKGLYVIVQSGDSVVLARLPKGFKPKEW